MLSIDFDNTYARDLDGMYLPVQGAVAPDPALLWLNEPLAVDLAWIRAPFAAPRGWPC